MNETLLFPCRNASRGFISLDGLWKFRFDPEGIMLSKILC